MMTVDEMCKTIENATSEVARLQREVEDLRGIRRLLLKALAHALGISPDNPSLLDAPMTMAVAFRKSITGYIPNQ